LLPSGKFSRFALFAALLAVLLLIYDLEFIRSHFVRLLLSNCLDTAVLILSAFCCFYVAFRSSGYARQVWILMAIALSIQSLGYILSTYYQSFVPGASMSAEPSDIFIFAWAAPVFMILLPRSEEQSSGVDLLRLLDFLQITIVAVTAYLYFFYFTSRWDSDQAALVRSILLIYIARDLLLSLAFLARSRSPQPAWFRHFAVAVSVSFLALVATHTDYLFTLAASTGDASWGDIVAMLPSVVIIGLAGFWKNPEPASFPAPASHADNLFTAQYFPVLMPLLVIFMARAIAPEKPLLAWLALGASVTCSSARLILTNRRQRRISDSLLAAEKALHRSEQLLSTAFRSSPDSFSISNFPEGRYIDVNENFTPLTGYTRGEVLGRTPLEVGIWIEQESRAKFIEDLRETGEVRNLEFLFRTKSGSTCIGQLSASLVTLDNQQCVLIAVRDITDRKAAEALLRNSEERFRSLVDNLHVGIVSCDADGRIVFANQAVLNMFSASKEQALGKLIYDLDFSRFGDDGQPLADTERPIQTAIRTGQAHFNQVLGLRRPGGTETVWTIVDIVPEYDSGKLIRFLVSLTNISEQRRASDALRESEERFRTLVRDLHVGVVLHSPNATVQFINQAALDIFGHTEQDVMGVRAEQLKWTPIDANGRVIPVEQLPAETVLRTKLPVRNAITGWRHAQTQQTLWLFGNAVPQYAPDGSVVRVITSFADITEMKNAERSIHQLSTELLKLQDEERRRIGRELHDGMAQTVLAVNLSLAQLRQSSQSLSDSSKRALDKARDLLQQMSREIRTLSYLLHPPLLDDLGLVTALKEYVNGFSERSGINITLELPPRFRRLPQIVETTFFRITQECLSNIQRHSGSKLAKVALRDDTECIRLEVTDYGRGISTPENGNSPRPHRLGVGIPGMRERMAQVGGHLEIDSNPRGTTVRACILHSAPVLQDAPHESAPSHRG
jgi:PAS domain S-box-containing protein